MTISIVRSVVMLIIGDKTCIIKYLAIAKKFRCKMFSKPLETPSELNERWRMDYMSNTLLQMTENSAYQILLLIAGEKLSLRMPDFHILPKRKLKLEINSIRNIEVLNTSDTILKTCFLKTFTK